MGIQVQNNRLCSRIPFSSTKPARLNPLYALLISCLIWSKSFCTAKIYLMIKSSINKKINRTVSIGLFIESTIHRNHLDCHCSKLLDGKSPHVSYVRYNI